MSKYKYKYEKYKQLYSELKSSQRNMIQNSKYNNITGGGEQSYSSAQHIKPDFKNITGGGDEQTDDLYHPEGPRDDIDPSESPRYYPREVIYRSSDVSRSPINNEFIEIDYDGPRYNPREVIDRSSDVSRSPINRRSAKDGASVGIGSYDGPRDDIESFESSRYVSGEVVGKASIEIDSDDSPRQDNGSSGSSNNHRNLSKSVSNEKLIVESIKKSDIIVILIGDSGIVGDAVKQFFESSKLKFNIILLNSKGIECNTLGLNIINNDDGFKSHSNTTQLLKKCESLISKIKQSNPNTKFFIINSVPDTDEQDLQKTMKDDEYTDVNYHWSIYFTDELVKFAKRLDIPLIHYSTAYVNTGIAPTDGWGIERKYIYRSVKSNVDDSSVYGYVKALTEDIILDNYSKSFVIRLPEIIDDEPEHFKDKNDLQKTSFSKVISELLYPTDSREKIAMDKTEEKYPITAKIVAKFTHDMIEKIKDQNIIVGGIINLGGTKKVTKHDLAMHVNDKYGLSRTLEDAIDDDIKSFDKMAMLDTNLPKCLKGLSYTKYSFDNPIEAITTLYKHLFDNVKQEEKTIAQDHAVIVPKTLVNTTNNPPTNTQKNPIEVIEATDDDGKKYEFTNRISSRLSNQV
jgi:dTDP-4-dehydrorhamnose reductase